MEKIEGYIHESELTEEFLALRLAQLVGDPTEYSISKEEDAKFFQDLSRVDNAAQMLRATAAKDMVRYFGATDDHQRGLIRGAFSRTTYWATMLKNVSKPAKKETKLKGLRYK